MAPKVEICYMDDEIRSKGETKEWQDGEYEAFIERFRWMQQHGEPYEDSGNVEHY
jgi:hypothetical protein